MAQWATIGAERGWQKTIEAVKSYSLMAAFGFLLARSNIEGIYPFGLALIPILFTGRKNKIIPGLLGVLLGTLTVQNYTEVLHILGVVILSALIIPRIRALKGSTYIIAGLVSIFTVVSSLTVNYFMAGINSEKILFLGAKSVLAAVFFIVLSIAMENKENLLKGEFGGEHGMAWLLVLAVILSGLQGIFLGEINIQITVLSFFILFIADRHGAGAGAGSGAILGFLLHWNFGIDNLIDAGIFGMLGFICGGFKRYGKIGISISYISVILMVSFFVNEAILSSHLYSFGLGLLAFLIMPGRKKDKNILKSKVMPEIETTVSKVKTLAEIFDQLAFGYQAAGLESNQLRPEVPELMNTLVERVCKNCPTMNACWEKEFYRTYNFFFDLLLCMENNDEINPSQYPPEWKKNCGYLKEVILAAHFIIEQQKDRETWQKRLALNREALAEQYRSVSEVIGHLARELHSRHNIEKGKPLVWSRQHRQMLDLGAATFIKTGNGISGDNYNSVPLSPTKNALIVCDGMGVGEEAARMSSAALTILEQLLSTGFDPEGAVKALNSILVLRSPEESFVTIDMVVLDLELSTAKLIKIGASPTYVIREGKVDLIRTSSLPAGILNDIDIPVIDIGFNQETLVIVTDGILDVAKAKGQADWLKEFLSKQEYSTAQETADAITSEAVNLAEGKLDDDGVVLVVKRKH